MEVKIWGDIVWETRIWFPIVLAFLLGALPLWLIGRATKWRLRRKLDSVEKALVAATLPVVPPPAPILTPADPALANPADASLPLPHTFEEKS